MASIWQESLNGDPMKSELFLVSSCSVFIRRTGVKDISCRLEVVSCGIISITFFNCHKVEMNAIDSFV